MPGRVRIFLVWPHVGFYTELSPSQSPRLVATSKAASFTTSNPGIGIGTARLSLRSSREETSLTSGGTGTLAATRSNTESKGFYSVESTL
jgi:hypothetical protein